MASSNYPIPGHEPRPAMGIGSPAAEAEENFNFCAWMNAYRMWSAETFGPATPENDRRPGVVDHIRKELMEVLADPDDLEEWADIVILATDGAWRAGATPQKFAAILTAKQMKNRARSWPDWRTIPVTKAITHLVQETDLHSGGASRAWLSPGAIGRLAIVLGRRDKESMLSAASRCIRERGEAIAERVAMEEALDHATVELKEADDALVEVRTDIATYQETIAGLEAQVMDLERDVGHLRGQRAEMAELLAQVCHEADQEVE